MKFCKDISGHLNGLDIPPGCKSICAGDWNLIFDTRMDSLGGKSKLERKSIYQLNSIMSSYYLIDIWRIRNPALRQYIWRRKIPRQMNSLGGKSKLERKSIYQLNSIMSSYYLIDIWRIRNPALRQYIWRRKIPRQMSTKSVREG